MRRRKPVVMTPSSTPEYSQGLWYRSMKVPATARGWVEVTTPADAEGKRGISMVRRMKRSIVKAE
jgi:hypothetical protein